MYLCIAVFATFCFIYFDFYRKNFNKVITCLQIEVLYTKKIKLLLNYVHNKHHIFGTIIGCCPSIKMTK